MIGKLQANEKQLLYSSIKNIFNEKMLQPCIRTLPMRGGREAEERGEAGRGKSGGDAGGKEWRVERVKAIVC